MVCGGFVNSVMDLLVLYKTENFLKSSASVCFSVTTVLYCIALACSGGNVLDFYSGGVAFKF
jgi:hypothetical protein